MKIDKIFDLIKAEERRQRQTINLIASENYASAAVREATGSVLTNKYAEGLPRKRYYGGTAVVDEIEQITIDRAKKLFGAEHANVQPHSGAQANQAAYWALLKPGAKVLAMDLKHGGHLTHGASFNFSGQLYEFYHYGTNRSTQWIDMGEVEALAKRHKPAMIIAGYSAYSRRLDFSKFRQIADSVGAILLVDMAHFAGLAAAGAYPNPVPYADVVTSTTHKTLRGPRGGLILCKSKYAELIDRAVFPGIQGGPLEHVIAAKAIGFAEAAKPAFKQYQRQVIKNAKVLASELQKLKYKVISMGTDNHLLLIDVIASLGMTGLEAEQKLGEVGIVVNRNTIPFDQQKPTVASGIRIGTPAVTTRGMKESQMKQLAQLIHATLSAQKSMKAIIAEVAKLTRKFPVPR